MRERLRMQRTARQPQPTHDPTQTTSPAASSIAHTLADGGQPLPEQTRAELEPHFGFDFSKVSIFANDRAARAARSVDAAAFTVGSNVVFGAGRYAPETPAGRRLVAHELTHVVQQATGPVSGQPVAEGVSISTPDDPHEQAAERMSERVTSAPVAQSVRGAAGWAADSAHGSGLPVTGPQAAASRSTAHGAVIQRWVEREHKQFGDLGSGGRAYEFAEGGAITQLSGPRESTAGMPLPPPTKWGEPPKHAPFDLTHGDLNLLGDWFSLEDTITVEVNGQQTQQPNPDSLFVLAATPSTDPGQKQGTRDEIMYALYKNVPNDPRFQMLCSLDQPDGGTWAEVQYSKEVKDAVESRYLRLASANKEHFSSPGKPLAPGQAPAGASYRAWHEDALWRAYLAGQANQDIGAPLAREAAAQHFLTDYFSAGHLRTPIAAIREHWHNVYPLFFNNLKKKIALDVAHGINDEFDPGAWLGTVNVIYDTALGTVEEVTEGMPPFTFGDVVGRIMHDVDNVAGLAVVNDFGERWYTYGDSHLDTLNPENRALSMGKLAVQLGNGDVEYAYGLGSGSSGTLTREALFTSVRTRSGSVMLRADKYAPELVVPRLDPARDNGTQNWRAASVDDLWPQRVRTDLPQTFGEAVKDNLEQGEIGSELRNVADKVDAEMTTDLGTTVHPRAAYLERFLQPLVEQPLIGLKGIIDFNPNTGQVWFNEDDIVREELEGTGDRKGMDDNELRGLTVNQRADRIKALVEGTLNYVDEDDGKLVISLFETAKPADRMQIYRLVEGHAWTGDWVEGVFVDDDEIYNSLNDDQLDRLRAMINGK